MCVSGPRSSTVQLEGGREGVGFGGGVCGSGDMMMEMKKGVGRGRMLETTLYYCRTTTRTMTSKDKRHWALMIERSARELYSLFDEQAHYTQVGIANDLRMFIQHSHLSVSP